MDHSTVFCLVLELKKELKMNLSLRFTSVFLMYFFEHRGLGFLYMKQNKTVNGIFALEVNSVLNNELKKISCLSLLFLSTI